MSSHLYNSKGLETVSKLSSTNSVGPKLHLVSASRKMHYWVKVTVRCLRRLQ